MHAPEKAQRHRRFPSAAPRHSRALRCILALVLLLATALTVSAQASPADAPLPQAPQPQSPAAAPTPSAPSLPPCPTKPAAPSSTAPTASQPTASLAASGTTTPRQTTAQPCKPAKPINWFARFLNGPEVKPLSPKEKAWLAVRNLVDPFNAVTILGQSGIAVASDSHSPYGPGMPGFARNVGVSYAEDATGEFFGTFVIPSIMNQDPHYHRMPNASIRRRAFHAAGQIFWTRGDNDRGMLNYSNLLGSAIDIGISNLYVPGEQTRFSASASRYAIGLASDPIDNYITEFLPDVARHIHVRIVLVQRIINQVATSQGGGTP